ncbi:RIO1 family-domain-containing protein [Mycena crocata]|nr:RIO1 family-domain-containing protein [Mycena crocata]
MAAITSRIDDGALSDSLPDEWQEDSDLGAYSDDSGEYSDTRVEDEDWERAEGDFTKHFNRLRQHVAVRTGNAQGTSSALGTNAAVVAVPALNHPSRSTNQATKSAKTTHAPGSDQQAALAKYSSRIAQIDVPYSMTPGVGVNRKGPSASANIKDRADRATTEQVLDPRTRTILLKMVGRGLIDEVNGCVSTGKEANVYHALTPDKAHLALKIYKTSILVFKDRDKYVSGEHRFRRGYARHNPRKMVRLWAEKEMRNLKRLRAAGIRAPDPLEVRENVLVMSFLGDAAGWAAPRLKDAVVPDGAAPHLYAELLLALRTMFHRCRLVHADLSEYNVLFHKEHLWIIDVSQSVEHDHPAAFDFLRKDLKNAEDFFARRGVRCLGLRRAFEFVTTERLPVEAEDEISVVEPAQEAPVAQVLGVPVIELQLASSDAGEAPSALDDTLATFDGTYPDRDETLETPETRNALAVLRRWLAEDGPDDEGDTQDLTHEQEARVGDSSEVNGSSSAREHAAQEDAVFLRAHIPRSLNDVADPAALARGEAGGIVYRGALGIVDERVAQAITGNGKGKDTDAEARVHFAGVDGAKGESDGEEDGEDEVDESEEEGSDEDEDGDKDGEGTFEERQPRGHRHEDRDAKKERKKAVKAEAKERRKHKMPKAEKKRSVKKGSRGS